MQLYTRHDEILQLSSRPGEVSANYYNHVQKALSRLGDQIRLTIPKLKHLDLIIQKDAWIIVDIVLNDMPVAAWTQFEVKGRSNLHEPIHCEVRFFHYAAFMVLDRTLEAMELMLGEALQQSLPEDKADVLDINRD